MNGCDGSARGGWEEDVMGRRGWLTVLSFCLAALVGLPAGWSLTHSTVSNLGRLPAGVSAGSQSPSTPALTPAQPAPVANQIPVQEATLNPRAGSPVPAPVELQIPTLGVDAPVETIGVRPDGTVAIPNDAHHVGWYQFGPAPGARRGSAVIVGHRDSRTQGRGAVYDLAAVNLGDVMKVRLSNGAVLTYRVVERRLYLKQGLPWQEFFTTHGPARLTVITCGGSFLPDQGGYQDNLIVTAVPT
jgi:sortase (surface protein transpeptidase)